MLAGQSEFQQLKVLTACLHNYLQTRNGQIPNCKISKTIHVQQDNRLEFACKMHGPGNKLARMSSS